MALVRRGALSRAVTIGVAGAMVALSVVGAMRSTGASMAGRGLRAHVLSANRPGRTLRLYYTPPVLVRAGEQVAIPVDAVCATDEGEQCATEVGISARAGDEPWHSVLATAAVNPRFDLTDLASRARPSGSVSFALQATDGAGAVIGLGTTRKDAGLRFYVVDRMPMVSMPAVPFGDVRTGHPVLALPWGSGPLQAGLELGNESDTVGPMSFDVDSEGRVYLLDSLQHRLALFDQGRLTGQLELPGVLFDIAVENDGSAFVLSRSEGSSLEVRRISPSGLILAAASLGEGVPGQIRVANGRAFANLLPLDAWAEVPGPGYGLGPAPAVHIGRPVEGGREILRVARQDSVRLGTVSEDGRVTGAVELRSAANIGEVAMAESDGAGGYWVAVHLWQEAPEAADQYQVVNVRGGEVLSSFAVPAQLFAAAPPQNRFRLVGDSLYQMTSSPEGLQIVQYQLGGAS
jgi:hypothetical protein